MLAIDLIVLCLTGDHAKQSSQALDLAEKGMDFADALHLTRSRRCEGFVTFDRKLVKAAKAAGYQGMRDA
ncbi:hypothetical protein [Bradyrhizobium sp. WSM3983]|uniref:hypothetical protein n=1 Tax=Bradyrhizobium sp. WSM3983 TaxID=1038867 RepID=UPI0003F93A6D|nr:hypothetical protein [Bradyrhizobium sp. WSM3983]